jgi:hypothetical protein
LGVRDYARSNAWQGIPVSSARARNYRHFEIGMCLDFRNGENFAPEASKF